MHGTTVLGSWMRTTNAGFTAVTAGYGANRRDEHAQQRLRRSDGARAPTLAWPTGTARARRFTGSGRPDDVGGRPHGSCWRSCLAAFATSSRGADAIWDSAPMSRVRRAGVTEPHGGPVSAHLLLRPCPRAAADVQRADVATDDSLSSRSGARGDHRAISRRTLVALGP
jgi:hypothetical protein